jgi:iron complex transport system substrate-binding protein
MRRFGLLCAGLAILAGCRALEPEAPRAPVLETRAALRVVSMNACADYLALRLAAPGQLVSVSWLARDPAFNPAADLAQAMPVNRGQAEEVLPLKADVVLAGTLTTRATVSLLQGLGVRVVEVPYASTIDDVRRNIRVVAAALGREQAGAAMIAELEAKLAQAARDLGPASPTLAFYGSGGSLGGRGSLSGDIARHTGWRNLADRLNSSEVTVEDLLFAKPDLIVSSAGRDGAPTLGQLAVTHPALRGAAHLRQAKIPGAWLACEGPAIGEAARALAAARP